MNSMLIFAVVAFAAISPASSASGEIDRRACILDNQSRETHLLHDREGFFAQPLGSDKILISGTWTGHNNNETPSVQYDLKSRTYAKITPGFDPYPTVDGKFYVQPSPVRFYSTDEIKKTGSQAPTLGSFLDHTGYYQSVGQSQNSKGQAVYRVLTAQGEGLVRDYVFNGKTIEAVGGAPTPLCKNLTGREALDWALPVLARDGKKFSTLNPKTGTTQVYDIEMPGGKCTLNTDLGVATGKLSFSFDGKFATFPATLRNGEYRVAYIYNFDTKQISLATPPSINREVYYSTYFPDGRIGVMYFRTLKDELKAPNAVAQGVSTYGFGQPVMTMIDPLDSTRTPTSSELAVAKAVLQDCPELANLNSAQIAVFMNRENCKAVAKLAKRSNDEECNLLQPESATQKRSTVR